MNKHLSVIAVTAFALCGTYNQASAEDHDRHIYGIAMMQCSTITNVFKGIDGQLAMISYIGGFVSALNLISDIDGDVLNGTSIDDAASSIFKYCKKHRGDQGQSAIMNVLKTSMKE